MTRNWKYVIASKHLVCDAVIVMTCVDIITCVNIYIPYCYSLPVLLNSRRKCHFWSEELCVCSKNTTEADTEAQTSTSQTPTKKTESCESMRI